MKTREIVRNPNVVFVRVEVPEARRRRFVRRLIEWPIIVVASAMVTLGLQQLLK